MFSPNIVSIKDILILPETFLLDFASRLELGIGESTLHAVKAHQDHLFEVGDP